MVKPSTNQLPPRPGPSLHPRELSLALPVALLLFGCSDDGGPAEDEVGDEGGSDESDEQGEEGELPDPCEPLTGSLLGVGVDPDGGFVWVQDLSAPGQPGALTAVFDGNAENLTLDFGYAVSPRALLFRAGLEQPDTLYLLDHDAPFDAPAAVSGIPPALDHLTASSPSGDAFAVVTPSGAETLHIIPMDEGGAGAAVQVEGLPTTTLTRPAFSTSGQRLYVSAGQGDIMTPFPVRDLYAVEIQDGAPSPAVALTAFPEDIGGAGFIHAATDEEVFFSVSYPGAAGILFRADLNDWPEVDAGPVQPSTLNESNDWTLSSDYDTVLWVHGPNDGLVGNAELIRIEDGVAQAPVPFDTPATIDGDTAAFSTNDRYAFLVGVGEPGQLYAADLDGPTPSATTPVGNITYSLFGQLVQPVRGWVVWNDGQGVLRALSTTGEELGDPLAISAPGDAVSSFQTEPCGFAYWSVSDQPGIWMIDLRSEQPGEPQRLHHELGPDEQAILPAYLSPIDDRLFYRTLSNGNWLTWSRPVDGGPSTELGSFGESFWSTLVVPGQRVVSGST